MRKLSIAKGIDLPLDIVTQTIAILAKRRAGKSYAMRRLVEQLFKADQQVILVDPKGDQWGIRSTADGKRPGLPIVILGGEHGDAPLEVNAGEVVAKLVVEERVSILLDLSPFRKHEIATFMTAFLENLYRLKAQEQYRTPCMLVIDEADAIAPQKPQKGEERMLGAADDIVRRGGQRGIGCALITQRSAVLNKNVLTQAQMLVVLRTIAPQDLAAMKAWIEVHGDLEQGKELMSSLPSLPTGDAWFWSPGWPTADGIFKRSHVLPIETFDSGATPAPGVKKVVPKNLADVDLNSLKKQMADTIEKAKDNDPKLLKKRIAELEKNKDIGPMGVSQWMEYGKKYGYHTFFENKIKEPLVQQFDRERQQMIKEVVEFPQAFSKIAKIVNDIISGEKHIKPVLDIEKIFKPSLPVKVDMYTRREEGMFGKEKTITGGAMRMLKVLVSRYPMQFSRSQLATLSKLSPKSGTYGTYLTTLRTMGVIEESRDLIMASKVGLDLIGDVPNKPQSASEIQQMWRNNLSGGAIRMFDILIENYPNQITKEQLGRLAGISPTSGTFGTYLTTLRSNGLIETSKEGVSVSDTLFMEIAP